MSATPYADLSTLAVDFRGQLETKKFILLYAYNGTGKTRLSGAFKDTGKQGGQADTLYFNAYTEDLFSWHNDLDGDSERYLMLHPSSKFFAGLEELEMDNRIRPLLQRYADFGFKLDAIPWKNDEGKSIGERRIVRFWREVVSGDTTSTVDNIKISRGEENIFIWCFFLATIQLAIDDDGTGPYNWVKYIYIDDPISSLDENNAIAVANHLAQMLMKSNTSKLTVVSTHHPLFFNVLCNEFGKKARKYFLKAGGLAGGYVLDDVDGQEFLHHLSTLAELNELQKLGALNTHHFNMLRRVMEQTANYFGMNSWKDCIKPEADDPDKTLYERVLNVMSHGDYSVFEPKEMLDENKDLFRRIFRQFISIHPFNPDRFPV